MSTISKAHLVEPTVSIAQGDIFENVRYSTIFNETNDYVDVKEYTYPFALVISQGCDVYWMDNLITNKTGSISKAMPMILLCPFYHFEHVKSGSFISSLIEDEKIGVESGSKLMYFGDDRKIASQDLHYRFHKLHIKYGEQDLYTDYVIDFKQCFTVPFSYLHQSRTQRSYSLDCQYAQQITLKFCNFMSRIGFE